MIGVCEKPHFFRLAWSAGANYPPENHPHVALRVGRNGCVTAPTAERDTVLGAPKSRFRCKLCRPAWRSVSLCSRVATARPVTAGLGAMLALQKLFVQAQLERRRRAQRIVIVRDRKDPRRKVGNDQKVPLIDATGFDTWQLLQQQKFALPNTERVFPDCGRSVGTAFRRACRDLKTENLHFHELPHEATSRPFEAGFAIHEVALVTGHKDWKILKRYANLRPEDLIPRNDDHAAEVAV